MISKLTNHHTAAKKAAWMANGMAGGAWRRQQVVS